MKRHNRGQTIVEYVLIIAIIVVAAIGILGVFSDTVREKLSGVVHIFGGDTARADAAVQIHSEDVMRSLKSDGVNSGG